MNRLHQFVLITATLAVSWLAMQAVHELGHVLGTIYSGGTVADVVLHPATLSYTRVAENPNPLLVAWLGPLVGVALPLVGCAIAGWTRLPGWYLVQYFAGFCLVANGAYLLRKHSRPILGRPIGDLKSLGKGHSPGSGPVATTCTPWRGNSPGQDGRAKFCFLLR